MSILNLKGKSPREINQILNEHRRKLNNDIEKQCIKSIRDEDDLDEVRLRIAERKAARIQDGECPDNYVEISEEKVDEIISSHDDDFE